jgi:hypothetical protein
VRQRKVAANPNSPIGAAKIIVMAEKNVKGSQPVPIEPSLFDWAEYWYPISWKGVLAGGVITAVGACATIAFLLLQWRTTSIREEQSEVRTVALEAQTAQANAALGTAQADIAKANAQIAEANARALEAQVALVKFKAPRSLSTEQQASLIFEMKQFAGQKYSLNVFANAESIALLDMLKTALASAGWILLPTQLGDLETNGAGISNNSGLSVGVTLGATNEMVQRAVVVAGALTRVGLPATPHRTPGLKIGDAINIVVGQKPQ